MAEADYQRLGAACYCGQPVKLWSGRGRRPKYCEGHTGPPRPKAKEQKECPACRGIFVSARYEQTYCSRTCGSRTRRGNKPRDEVRSFICAHCSSAFESRHPSPMYCRKACKKLASMARDPERKTAYAARARAKRVAMAPPPLCAYFAKHCERCGKADGRRQEWALCRACSRADALSAGRAASLALNVAKHKAAGREVECDECGAVYCPLYGRNGPKKLCSEACAQGRRRQQARTAKIRRYAAERGAEAENVNPWMVFERDGWSCRLCNVNTPKRLRGTYEHNAPELDHVVPLSRGGPHTYANTQCLCRSCNGFKSDRTMDEVERALAA